MSKKEVTERPQDTKTVKQWNVATVIPWTIIVVLIVAVVAFISAWNLRSGDLSQMDAKAYQIAESKKVSQ